VAINLERGQSRQLKVEKLISNPQLIPSLKQNTRECLLTILNVGWFRHWFVFLVFLSCLAFETFPIVFLVLHNANSNIMPNVEGD